MIRFILLISLMASLTACGGQMSSNPHNNPVLQTYTIPEGMGEQIVDMLNRNFTTLSTKEDQAPARADLLPNGQIALLATPQIQAGIPPILEGLKNVKAPKPRNAQIKLWFVISKKGTGQTQEELAPIMPALKEIGLTQSDFTLLEKVNVLAASGMRATHRGQFFQVGYRLFPKESHLLVDLSYEATNSSNALETRIYLQHGKTMILGEALYQQENPQQGIETGMYNLYAILQTEEVDN